MNPYVSNIIQLLVDILVNSRHGKTGGSGRVRVGSIGSRVKTGYGSKRVIFKRVNWVAGQMGRGLSRVELTRIFQNFFFFFLK